MTYYYEYFLPIDHSCPIEQWSVSLEKMSLFFYPANFGRLAKLESGQL